MKINYFLSDTIKTATTIALKEVIKRAEDHPFDNFVVIVPETKSIIIEKELLDLSKNKAFANIYIYSFVRLINRLGFVSSEKIVSKQTCVLLLRKIIYDNASKLNCYKKTAKTVGFAEKMYETISQFKSSNVTPEDLKLSLQTRSASLKAKLEDIVFLYEEYEKVLGDELYDDLDKLNLISKFAKTSEFIKNSEVFVVAFDNITYEMVSVLKDIATYSKELTFSCVYFNDKREDKHIQSNELYFKFKRVADELKYPYVPKFFNSYKSGDFYNIQNYLFSAKPHSVKSKGNVQIFEAGSKRQEIDFIACKILEEIKSGKRFKDIGLFVCDLEQTEKLIKECFDTYEIPYFINQSYDVSNHYFAKFLLGAFDLISNRCSADKVLNFVANPIWKSEDFAPLYKYFRETGVSYEAIFEYVQKREYTIEFETQIKTILERIKTFYYAFKEKVLKCKTFSDFCDAICWVLEYFNVHEVLEEIAVSEEERGFKIDAEITRQIFEKQQKFMLSAINFMGLLELGFDEFVQIYHTGFSSLKINLSPVSIDTVIVQDNTDGFYNIKTMFIMGAEEGKFPVKIDDSGIILDRELEETTINIKMPVEPTVKDINKRENFRIYEAFLEPSEKLFISYSLSAYDGKSNTPARAVLRLIGLFGKEILTKNYNTIDFINYNSYSKKFAKNVNKYLNAQKANFEEINSQYNELKGHFGEEFEKFLQDISFDKSNFTISNTDGLYFYGDKTSVSQLEKYFTCPYQFFATYGLKLKENRDAKLSSLDVGTIIHRVAELFMNDILKVKDASSEDFDNFVSKLLLKALEEQGFLKNKNQAIINLMLVECRRLCKHIFVEQSNSGFKHKVSEWKFSGQNAVKFRLENGKEISIEGKIDRIDEFGNYVRIIDYKTGNVDSDYNAIYYGTKIQLISYLSAVTKYGDKKVAGVFYLPIHSDYAESDKMLKSMYKMQGFMLNDIDVVKNMDYTLSLENDETKTSYYVPLKVKASQSSDSNQIFDFSGKHPKNMSENEFENVKNYTEILCKNAVEEILMGNIEPAPFALTFASGTSKCAYCKFAGFCGLENSRFKFGRIGSSKVQISSFDLNKEGEENE